MGTVLLSHGLSTLHYMWTGLGLSLNSHAVLQATASRLLLGHALYLCVLLSLPVSLVHGFTPAGSCWIGFLLDAWVVLLFTQLHSSLLPFVLLFLLSIPHPHSNMFYIRY